MKKGGEIDVHQHGRHAGDDLTQGNQYFSLPKHSVQSFHSSGPFETGTTVSFFSAATSGCRRPKKKYDDTQVQQTAQQQHGDYGVPKLGAIGAFRARVSFFDVICSAGEAKKTSVPEAQKKNRISTKRSHLPHSSVSRCAYPGAHCRFRSMLFEVFMVLHIDSLLLFNGQQRSLALSLASGPV